MSKVSGQVIKTFLSTYSSLGYCTDELNNSLDFNLNDCTHPDKRVECRLIGEIKRTAFSLSNDPKIFLYEGKFFNPSMIGFIGYLMINSPTLREGIRKVVEHQKIIGDGVRHYLDEHSDGSADFKVVIVDEAIKEFQIHIIESISSVKMAFISHMLGPDAKAIEMHFEYDQPEYIDLYQEVFSCPLIFNSNKNSMKINSSILDQPLKSGNPKFFQFFEDQLKKQLSELEENNSILSQINNILIELRTSGDFSIDIVASKLNMGTRTLQRRLKDEGVNYNNVLQTFKKTIAENYIKQNNFSISEIAYMLGFSEPSAFHRFFKKWTGKTPKEFRAISFQS